MMPQLPNDPMILLSFTNTYLRDYYESLTEFCKAFMIDELCIMNKLATIDYAYDKKMNQFI